jgi:hypothetical protein
LISVSPLSVGFLSSPVNVRAVAHAVVLAFCSYFLFFALALGRSSLFVLVHGAVVALYFAVSLDVDLCPDLVDF